MDYSRTGSSRGVYKRNGEIMAIPHAGIEASWALNEKTAARGQTQRLPHRKYPHSNACVYLAMPLHGARLAYLREVKPQASARGPTHQPPASRRMGPGVA